jgi:predicted RNA-binding protein with PUA-like domain
MSDAKKRGPCLWLLKTEPGDYSYDDLERDASTAWDGVRNALALKHMREVRKGDEALVYHTGRERAAVGVARVASDPYPDPEAGDPRVVAFDLRPGRRLARPVTLAEIKQDPAFAGFDLVRLPRLSVMPVPPALWKRVLALGEGR